MKSSEIKNKARASLILEIDKETRAWIRFSVGVQHVGWVNRGMPRPEQLSMERARAESASSATKAAVDAFAAACEEETRAGIAEWIANAPARMDAQAAAGATSLHYMHDIGQLAAASSLAEAIKNKADLKDQGSR